MNVNIQLHAILYFLLFIILLKLFVVEHVLVVRTTSNGKNYKGEIFVQGFDTCLCIQLF